MAKMSLVALDLPQKLTEGEGGSYYGWNSTVFPFLAQGKVSGGKLILKPRGFAFPHYADCNKIAYVIQGTNGVAAMIYPGSTEEKAVKLEKGDTVFVESKAVSWWFNAGDDDLEIIFLGGTQNASIPGEITYYLFAGAIGILKGFSPNIVSRAYDVSEQQANELTNSQKLPLITTISQEIHMPKPSKHEHITISFDKTRPEILVENGGSMSTLTSENYSALEGIQLSGKLLKLDPNATFGPSYYAGSFGTELIYITKGSGRVQVVGMNGQTVLDSNLEAGNLFAIPKFNVVAIVAGNEGIECFSIITTSKPILGEVAGKNSIWKAMSPEVVQASLNANPELVELFMNNNKKTTIIMPPN